MNQNLTDLLLLSLSLHIAHRYPRIPSTPKHYSASDNTPAALQHQEETPTETKCLSISSVLLHSLVNVIHMPLQCFPLLYTQADSCNSHSMYREQGMNYSGWFLQWWQYIQKTGHELLQLIAKMVTVHRENRAQTTQADSCDSHTQYTERTGHKLLRLIPVTVTHSTQREQAKLLRLIPVTVTHSTQREQGMNYSGWFLQWWQYTKRYQGTVITCGFITKDKMLKTGTYLSCLAAGPRPSRSTHECWPESYHETHWLWHSAYATTEKQHRILIMWHDIICTNCSK